MKVTKETLDELGAGDIPMIYVYNKADRCMDMEQLPRVKDKHIHMSAVNSVGIEELTELIKSQVYADTKDVKLLIPYDRGDVVSYFMENATVYQTEYLETGVEMQVNCHLQDVAKYQKYVQN